MLFKLAILNHFVFGVYKKLRKVNDTGENSKCGFYVPIYFSCHIKVYSYRPDLEYEFAHTVMELLYIYALLTKREVKMTGYCPSYFIAFLWTETKSRSIKTEKKNEANIQPS